MSKKLFVGGLSWGTTDDGLHGAFSQFGEIVEAKVITDRETGRSRGFGFVTFANDEGATKAIAEMDGTELDGRTIKVNEAEDKPARTAAVAAADAADTAAAWRSWRRRRRSQRRRRRSRTRRVVAAAVAGCGRFAVGLRRSLVGQLHDRRRLRSSRCGVRACFDG